jgi:peptidoglycan/xylan/chitin deacetylase (PgdA/CDA1 family)
MDVYPFLPISRRKLLSLLSAILRSTGLLRLIAATANRFKAKTERNRYKFPFVKRANTRDVQILVYHRVNDDNDPFFRGTPVNIFARQMQYLAETYHVISLEEAVERITANDLPESAIVITFDDGYRDNYLQAFPILKRLGLSATVFLATGAIGTAKILWHDRVFNAFRETRVPVLEPFAGANTDAYRLGSDEEKFFAQSRVLRLLRSVDDDERLRLIDKLADQLKVDNRTQDSTLMLSWDEVREMSRHAVSFGSHTVSHPILSTLTTEKANREIADSKAIIERELGRPVTTFAYPNGTEHDFTNGTKNLLREAGYVCGVTTLYGSNGTAQDLFELRRATPWDENISSFGLRLCYYKFCSS